MKWEKLGLVYVPDGSLWWAKSYATCPTPVLAGDRIRVYVQCRDSNNVGRIGIVELAADDPTRVLDVRKDPVFEIGRPGTFDENGVMQLCFVPVADRRIFLYYVGFELGAKIRYRLLTGLAVSSDGGNTFERVKKTPILERSDSELYVRGGPWVRYEDGRFRMWYVGGSAWTNVDGREVPVYDIRYIESVDGIAWPDQGATCLEVGDSNEIGFGRPYVVPWGQGMRMFYSVRLRSLGGGYTIGMADSPDGKHWTRRDQELGLSRGPAEWDSINLDYAACLSTKDATYLFYNGNNYGLTGFGAAKLISDE